MSWAPGSWCAATLAKLDERRYLAAGFGVTRETSAGMKKAARLVAGPLFRV
jgi:hypothetical protein